MELWIRDIYKRVIGYNCEPEGLRIWYAKTFQGLVVRMVVHPEDSSWLHKQQPLQEWLDDPMD